MLYVFGSHSTGLCRYQDNHITSKHQSTYNIQLSKHSRREAVSPREATVSASGKGLHLIVIV